MIFLIILHYRTFTTFSNLIRTARQVRSVAVQPPKTPRGIFWPVPFFKIHSLPDRCSGTYVDCIRSDGENLSAPYKQRKEREREKERRKMLFLILCRLFQSASASLVSSVQHHRDPQRGENCSIVERTHQCSKVAVCRSTWRSSNKSLSLSLFSSPYFFVYLYVYLSTS